MQVNFTDDAGNDETLTSAPTDAVAAAPEPAANNPATGSPAVTGTAQVGETLTVDTSGIGDEDGLENATISYQWLADGTAISGATADAYTPVEADEGKAVTVQVNFTDDAGNDETLTSAPTDAVAAAQPTEPPAKPRGLSATATHNQVVLTWSDPQDDSITGYVILRRIPGVDPEGQFSELVSNTGTDAATYTDDTVSAETRYTYRIKAINEHGVSERSRWSHIDTQAPPDVEPGSPEQSPANLTAELVEGQVVLSWDPPAEDAAAVTGYEVLRAEGEGELAALAADTGSTATSYTDATVASAGYSYAYRVKAIRDGERSGASNKARALLKPAKPTGLSAETVAYDTVALTWDEPQDDSITGYAVMRLDFVRSDMITLAADTGSAATAHTDETADAPGESYAYTVKAIRDGERSQASGEAVIQMPGPPPSAPAGLIASFGAGGIFLNWQGPVEDADAITGYEVLRAQGEGELTILVADTGNAATAYTDATAGGASERYAYRVRAIRDGDRSADSNEAAGAAAAGGPQAGEQRGGLGPGAAQLG